MTTRPVGYDECNIYTTIIVDEALRRGIDVEILDPGIGELRLRHGDRTVDAIQSLSDLTSAVAFRRCDDKALTRRILQAAGLPVPPGRVATRGPDDDAFLEEHGDIVVKPVRGEGGHGITVGVTDPAALARARSRAAASSSTVLLEARCHGDDLRVVVIGDEVVAASVRRPPTVTGDGSSTVQELIDARNRRSPAGLGVPLDDITETTVCEHGVTLDAVLDAGKELVVRATANLHTGGTIQDVTDEVHPDHLRVALAATRALELPVAGVDLMVDALDEPRQRIIEVNEQPGLANHEPRPTAERYLDLLFPETA